MILDASFSLSPARVSLATLFQQLSAVCGFHSRKRRDLGLAEMKDYGENSLRSPMLLSGPFLPLIVGIMTAAQLFNFSDSLSSEIVKSSSDNAFP